MFTLKDLIHAGIHIGHHPSKWNPMMAPFIFGIRNSVHIINLEKTGPLLKKALIVLRDTVTSGGSVLFIGTKQHASSIIADVAIKSGQYFINHRWIGGMFTNWETVSCSIKNLNILDELLSNKNSNFKKKEFLRLSRKRDNLNYVFGGVKNMKNLPDIIFVIDAQKERTAIKESNSLGIPVIAVVDSNTDPRGIDYIIPGNDDAIRAIEFYCNLALDFILKGKEITNSSVNLEDSITG